jgi:hypothetical protein
MADISKIVNVALIPEGKAAQPANMNDVSILTKEQGVLSTAERYRSYRSASAVLADFGALSEVTEFANTIFATSPNATQFGGSLIVGYWRGDAEEVTPATSGKLTGEDIDPAAALQALQSISDGTMNITIDGAVVALSALDFTGAVTMADVVSLLSIAGATVEYDAGTFTVASISTGAASTVGIATDPGTGTFIGTILGLTAGAVPVDGVDAEILPPETKLEGVAEVRAAVEFRGAAFIDPIDDADVLGLATWAKANGCLMYETFGQPAYLVKMPGNPVWDVAMAGLSNFRCLYSAANNRKLAASYMARAHTVNFAASNSAMTMQLKTLAVPAETYSDTVMEAAAAVGLDVYTTIKDVPVVVCSMANDFVDNVYNLIAFISHVQTDLFNVLKATGTKIPQTEKGVLVLIDQGEKTSRQFVRAGVFGPGEWASPDYFGDDIETFKANIREFGFYWLAGSLADQSQADRQARKSPVLQCAVKNQGAIHSVDVIINFNI